MRAGLAGGPGFEPGLLGSEPRVLPLNYPPSRAHVARAALSGLWRRAAQWGRTAALSIIWGRPLSNICAKLSVRVRRIGVTVGRETGTRQTAGLDLDF
jgi:hypothetical protein